MEVIQELGDPGNLCGFKKHVWKVTNPRTVYGELYWKMMIIPLLGLCMDIRTIMWTSG